MPEFVSRPVSFATAVRGSDDVTQIIGFAGVPRSRMPVMMRFVTEGASEPSSLWFRDRVDRVDRPRSP